MNNSRRTAIKTTSAFATLVSLGIVTQSQAQAAVDRASFQVKTLDDALKAIGGTPVASDKVSVVSPDIAENGAVVPVGAGTDKSGVKRLLILVEKNPALMAAMFELTDMVEPNVSTRVKMGQSSDVYAVALMDDGKVLFAKKEIKVTLGGCGG